MSTEIKTELHIHDGPTSIRIRQREGFFEFEFLEKNKGLPYNPMYDHTQSFFLNLSDAKTLGEYLKGSE